MRYLISIMALMLASTAHAQQYQQGLFGPQSIISYSDAQGVEQPYYRGGAQVNAARRDTSRQLTTEVLAQAENVVRVQRGSSFGSGTYLGDGLVLTCAHLWDRGQPVSVKVLFVDGQTIQGRPLKIDSQWDQAVIELVQIHPTAKGSRLAGANPVVGQGVTVAGYDGGKRRIKWRVGSVVKTGLSPYAGSPGDWFESTGQVTGGASGGPAFTDRGRLIGNLWGASNQRTTSLTTGRTRLFLAPWFPRLSAWGDRMKQGGPICSGPDCQPGEQPSAAGGVDVFETPVQPTQPTQPPIAVEKINYAKLLDMMATDSRFRGPKGDKGEPGESAQLDVMALAEAIKTTLPPIYFNLIGPDGKVISSEAIPLGGQFNLHHLPK